jgi:uncharacterized protein RhaS with RHS repeats
LALATKPTVGLRYYNPQTGRYISRDPIGYKDGGDVYLYVHCNPINRIDPLGLDDTIIVVLPKKDPPAAGATPAAATVPSSGDTPAAPEPGSRADTENTVKAFAKQAEWHNKKLDQHIEEYKHMDGKTWENTKTAIKYGGTQEQYVKDLQSQHLHVVAVDGALGQVTAAVREHVAAGDHVTVFGHSTQLVGEGAKDVKDSQFQTGGGEVPRGQAQAAVESAGGTFISCHPNNSDATEDINVEVNGFHEHVTRTIDPGQTTANPTPTPATPPPPPPPPVTTPVPVPPSLPKAPASPEK